MTLADWFFPVVAVIAVVLWRASVVWILNLHRADVTTKDALIFRDQQPHASPPVVIATLRGPAAKGFAGSLKDRRAHVLAMQARRRL